MAAAPVAMDVRRRSTATAAVTAAAVVAAALVAAATVTSAAVVAAAPSPPTGGWPLLVAAAARATLPASPLSVVGRPLTPSVSIFTDGTYGPAPGETPPAGCPTSFAISGALTTENNSFVIPAPRVTVDGAACAGEVPLVGVFGPRLAELLSNASDLVAEDPKVGVAVGLGGPLTCGPNAWAGPDQGFVFFVSQGTPVVLYKDNTLPDRECDLIIPSGSSSSPTATPAPE